jgi:acylphosphatase
VQGEVQGSDEKLKEFVQQLNKGPSAASVTKVEENTIDSKPEEGGFKVK